MSPPLSQTSGQVQSFNYNNGNGQHLADQDQVICVRRESQFNRICFYAENPTDFVVSGEKEKEEEEVVNLRICVSYEPRYRCTYMGSWEIKLVTYGGAFETLCI